MCLKGFRLISVVLWVLQSLRNEVSPIIKLLEYELYSERIQISEMSPKKYLNMSYIPKGYKYVIQISELSP